MTTPTVLEAAGVDKRFGGVRALRGARLSLGAGRVHGLLGQNGSGKSTLLRILSGQIAPDAGELRIDGEPVRFANPARALTAGVAIVGQELTLAADLSVAENVCLARREPRRWHGVAWRTMHARTAAVLELLGLSVDPRIPVRELRRDEQQLVEIGRAVSTNARILILDEPTASLTDDEVEALLGVVRELRSHGVSTVFVSHRLNEVLAIVDELTILRDGVTVATGPVAEWDAHRLVDVMVGREGAWRAENRAVSSLERSDAAPPVLSVSGLSVPGVLSEIDVEVRAGEIVGLAGLVGSGRSELLGALFGTHQGTGDIRIGDRRLAGLTPRRAIAAGIAYVPAERARHGLVLGMSVCDNIALTSTVDRPRLGRLLRTRERAAARDAVSAFRIVVGDTGQPAATLSGGNQQKVLLAKWLATQPRVLLLDEPTQGVDVAAKADIHRLLLEQARGDGVAMLVSSSEASELRTLCDRVVVLHRGRVTAHLAASEVSEAALLHHAMG